MKSKQLQKLEELNNILTQNKALFQPGVSISRDKLAGMFGISITAKGSYANVHRSNLRLVRLQSKLNKLLYRNGLCLRSKDYYTSFVVADEENLKGMITRNCAAVDTFTEKWISLETNYAERKELGTWGTYNKVKAKDLKALVDSQMSFRLETTQARVDNY